jgi:hypothetical protein
LRKLANNRVLKIHILRTNEILNSNSVVVWG